MNSKKNTTNEKEIDKLTKQFDSFDQQVKDLTLDRMNEAPVFEQEQQTKLSQKEIENSKEIYLKPDRWVADGQKFNEKFQKDWEFSKEYVQFVAEHKEIQGETIELWTHPFGGVGAQFWKVPCGKPVWGPRYLAEQIHKAKYHRLKMDEHKIISADGHGQYFGQMAVDSIIQRLDAHPVNTRKSIFMGKAA